MPGGIRAFGVLLVLAGVALFTAGLVFAEDRQAPLLQLTIDRAQDVRPVWSPDAKRVAFQSDRGSESNQYQIWTMNADGGDPRQLSHDEADDRHPVYSPDGQQIAFDSGGSTKREIWVMNIDGSNRRQVTRQDAFASFPSWSADGKHIAFYVYRAGVSDLWLVDADGSAERSLTKGLADERKSNCTNSCHRPAWAPDGRSIAISGGDHRSVWTVDVASASMTQVVDGTEHNHFPWYMADGRLAWIVEYVQQGAAYTDVVATDPAHPGAPQRLMSNVSVQGPYELSPDGQKVLFHSPRAGNFDIYIADTAASGGMQALQTSRTSADIGAGVPTPAPETTSRTSTGASAVIAHTDAVQAVGALPATAAPEAPPDPMLSTGIAALVLLGVAAVGITALQLIRRGRRR